jgi:hypothetical protein
MNKWGLEEIRAIRDRWAEMPAEEVEAEQKKLLASALRRIEALKKGDGKAQPKAKASVPKAE